MHSLTIIWLLFPKPSNIPDRCYLFLSLWFCTLDGQNCRKETLQLLSENLSRKNGGRSERWVTDNERRDICEVGTGKLQSDCCYEHSAQCFSRSNVKGIVNEGRLQPSSIAISHLLSVVCSVPLRYFDTGPGFGDICLIYQFVEGIIKMYTKVLWNKEIKHVILSWRTAQFQRRSRFWLGLHKLTVFSRVSFGISCSVTVS